MGTIRIRSRVVLRDVFLQTLHGVETGADLDTFSNWDYGAEAHKEIRQLWEGGSDSVVRRVAGEDSERVQDKGIRQDGKESLNLRSRSRMAPEPINELGDPCSVGRVVKSSMSLYEILDFELWSHRLTALAIVHGQSYHSTCFDPPAFVDYLAFLESLNYFADLGNVDCHEDSFANVDCFAVLESVDYLALNQSVNVPDGLLSGLHFMLKAGSFPSRRQRRYCNGE